MDVCSKRTNMPGLIATSRDLITALLPSRPGRHRHSNAKGLQAVGGEVGGEVRARECGTVSFPYNINNMNETLVLGQCVAKKRDSLKIELSTIPENSVPQNLDQQLKIGVCFRDLSYSVWENIFRKCKFVIFSALF